MILSEYQSKKFLSSFGIPTTKEILIKNEEELFKAGEKIGYPLVLKVSSDKIIHKTEQGLVRLNVRREELSKVYKEILKNSPPEIEGVLVQEQIKGEREIFIGMKRDKIFGVCVLLGLGGIFTEVIKDISVRCAPLIKKDTFRMMEEIKGSEIFENIRGKKKVNKKIFSEIIIRVGEVGTRCPEIKEIDMNPLIIKDDGYPVVCDAIIIKE